MQDLIQKPNKPLAAALGYFDGVHLGHRRVLGAAVEAARQGGMDSGVFTFVFGGENPIKGDAILSPAERRHRIAGLGLDWYYCPDYDSFCDLTPEQFVDEVLIGRMNAAAVFCGDNFTFGQGGAGNVPLLRRLCAARGITVTVVPMEQWGGRPVSSTRIRELLRAGQVEQANEMLGAPYALVAPVAHGKQIGGAKLGFPTINQRYAAGMLLPRSGVYLTQAVVAGRRYPAATGLGDRPTVDGTDITCESFLIGFDGNLYGDEVRLEFFHYLEPTRRFDSLEGLRDCIADAASRSNAFFASCGLQIGQPEQP